MAAPKFTHLHAHSHYSLLDGLGKLPDVVGRAKELGMGSLALTDHGVLYGAIEFYETATAAGIKPIIGCEAYVATGSRQSKAGLDEEKAYHLILLAQNLTGYRNLLKLISEAHLTGFYYKPRIDWELLQQHAEGLVCTSACLNGEVARTILNQDEAAAKQVVERYAKLFGPDRYFLEVQHNPSIPDQGVINAAVGRLAKEAGLGLVATNDVHYVLPEDSQPQDVLVCIQTGKLLEDTDRLNMTGEDFSLKSPTEMAAAFVDTPEAISNTQRIADSIDLELKLGGMILPKFAVPPGKTDQGHLRELVDKGMAERYGTLTPELAERLEYEMGVIEKVGYESYFLIVADFVNYAKDNGILVGPGRGSGAGSIIAYALKITNIDPMQHGLLFERFLNPDRISPPDFDIDFADDRRGEVIEYVEKKYGADHVAQIITFGTLGAKAAVRDTGRVLGLSYAAVDQVAKLIPNRPGTKLADARRQPDLQELEAGDPQIKRLLDLSERLEGVCRHASTHAAGVVIGDQPLVNYVPLQTATKGDTGVITQYSMWPLDSIGLLKMDFLGLSNLTILRNAVEIIEAVHGTVVDLDGLPLDDGKTFELLSAAQTYGVFQLESEGMRRYIKELKPTRFDDIVAMCALYRPGPMQFIDSFINRKHGREKVSYIHPKVEDALQETYGVIVYQEQVMQISKDLAGFTGGEADTLRKAMGKKIAKLMAQMRQKFIDGVVANGERKELGVKLFDQFEKFAEYGFPKAHAACYALIAYQTAYLKAHYRSPFMAALMTSEQGNLDKLTAAINECEQLGIKVLPPDVNESFADFAVAPDKQSIRFGLNAIKNVGHNTVSAIIASRKADGPFQNINDFLSRLPEGAANKKSLESLIKAGALDSLAADGVAEGRRRGQLLAGLEAMTRYAQAKAAEARSGQGSLFGEGQSAHGAFHLPPAPPDGGIDQRQRLEWERELLGMYVSEHPLSAYRQQLKDYPALTSFGGVAEGRPATVCGLVGIVKRITTRKGDPMAFMTIEDTHGQLEVIVFPNLYAEARALLVPGQILRIRGKVSHKDDQPKLLADRISVFNPEAAPPPTSQPANDEIEDIGSPMSARPVVPVAPVTDSASDESVAGREVEDSPDTVIIELTEQTNLATLEQIKDVLTAHRGESPVTLVIKRGGQPKRLRLADQVRYSQALVDALRQVHAGVSVAVD